MHVIASIAWREFKSYILTPIAYVYLIAFLVVLNWIFFRGFFLMGQADLRMLFGIMPWIFLFFAPAVAMGRWAEERRLGTLELIMTLPIRSWQAVAGKFLASLALMTSALILTLPAAATVALVGEPDWGPIIGGYLGAILLGGTYVSIGLACSALTENQIVAFIIGLVVCFILFAIGTPLIAGDARGTMAALLQYLALGTHFDSISRGVIDSRDIIYYVSVIVFFLFVNTMIVGERARKG